MLRKFFKFYILRAIYFFTCFMLDMNTPFTTKLITKNLIKNNPLANIRWKNAEENSPCKIFETFCLNKGAIGDVFVKISKYDKGSQNFIIKVDNRLGKNLGQEIISINDGKTKDIFGFNIQVENEYRRKSFRIGELLRLGSIMEMMENNSPYIKICAKDTAVYFHGKYKFEPAITSFEERDKILKSIISDTSPNFKDINDRAKKLLNEAESTTNNAAYQRELCVRTNGLAKEYIEKALLEKSPEKKHPFKYGLYMILKNETVKKFQDYFNAIFQKQGIDYKI